MTVAVVFPFPLEAGHLGKDLFLIPEGLRRLGAAVELHCPRAQPQVDWPIPVVEAGIGGLERREHYTGRGLSAAIVFSYLHFPRMLAAVREAGLRVVAKGDTTGESVARAHPRATLTHALFDDPTVGGRARGLAGWAARMGPLAGRDARELAGVLRLADVTVVETHAAHAEIGAALARSGDARLLDRIRVVPNPVADAFTTAAVPSRRDRLVVAIGRWDIAAKGGPLLAETFDRFLREHPGHRAVVVGSGDPARFHRPIERVGRLDQDSLAGLLGRARTVLVPSRWESFSLSTHEALTLGCSVVGSPLPPLRDIVSAGPFGTLGARSVDGLTRALGEEMRAWERGDRDAAQTAGHWRQRLTVDAAGRTFAELLEA